MDIASIVGLIAALALMIFGMVNGKGFGVIFDSFIHIPSALITFGGAFGAVLAMNPLKDFITGLKSFLLILKTPKQNEIDTIIHYPIPPHKQSAYKEWNNLSFPVTEKIHEQELSLPMSPTLTDEQVRFVIEKINSWKSTV